MKSTLIVAILLGFWISLPLYAQGKGDEQAPAELPPASFQGNQFVDSRGCVFLRATVDGNVRWVPQVDRDRELICRQTPTVFAGADSITSPPTEHVTVETAPVSQPETVRVNTANAPPTVSAHSNAPAQGATRPTPKSVAKPSTASGQSVFKTSKLPVPTTTTNEASPDQRRAGATPSPAPPLTVLKNRDSPSDTSRAVVPTEPVKHSDVTLQTRVVPQHIYDKRIRETTQSIPKGYRPAWDDGRLNPRRAEQSLEGIARTRMKWTDTVPRRLIDQNTGQDVTTTVPLVYPYTDVETQRHSLGTVKIVQRDGQIVKQVTRNKKSGTANSIASTGSTDTATQATASRLYVQVGVYAVSNNADAAAQRLTRAGLPARFGTLKRDRKSYRMVLSGPFTNSSEAKHALRQVRAAGFSDAYLRELR